MCRRDGYLLLEMLVALAVLASAGVVLVGAIAAGTRAMGTTEAAEERMRDADRVLAAASLLTRPDLERRLGEHDVRGWRVRVSRPEPGLFRIAVVDAGSGAEVLVTVVWRPEATR